MSATPTDLIEKLDGIQNVKLCHLGSERDGRRWIGVSFRMLEKVLCFADKLFVFGLLFRWDKLHIKKEITAAFSVFNNVVANTMTGCNQCVNSYWVSVVEPKQNRHFDLTPRCIQLCDDNSRFHWQCAKWPNVES